MAVGEEPKPYREIFWSLIQEIAACTSGIEPHFCCTDSEPSSKDSDLQILTIPS